MHRARWMVAAALLGAVWSLRAAADGAGGAGAAAPAETLTPSPRDEMRVPWSRQAEGFLREWLVLGPLPNPPRPPEELKTQHPVGAGFDVDYLQADGGEPAARPVQGRKVKRPDGSEAAWTRHVSPSDTVNFKAIFADHPSDNMVAYAYTTVARREAGQAILALGSDDSVKVWLNGALVHTNIIGRGVRKDDDVVPVSLVEGENALLLKVENARGSWGFVLRVLDPLEVRGLEAGGLVPRLEEPAGETGVVAIVTDGGLGGLTADPEPVTVEAVAARGQGFGRLLAKRGETVRFRTVAWPDGPYEFRLSQRTTEGGRAVVHLPWYKGDWAAQARQALLECDRLAASDARPEALRLRIVRDLILDRLGGDPRADPGDGKGPAVGPAGWRRVHAALMEHRELAERDAIRPCGSLRLAWVDPIDDSPQFARAYLPPDYDAWHDWPMVVNLHGYNPRNPPYVQWWSMADRHSRLADRHGVIVLEPHGRGNTSYRGIGDTDVLKAIAEAKRAFRVAEDRVYLMGYSMGGGGTWHVGTRHPELFAAIGPIYGGWDWHTDVEPDEFARLSPRERFMRDSWSSFALAESLYSTPVFVNHGDRDDLVNVEHSRYAVRMLQRWGYRLRYWEHPGKGHGGLGGEDELLRWFLQHRRDPHPREVRIRSPHLKTASAHWVRVEQQADPFAFLHVVARAADRRTVRLDTENVLQVRLAPGAGLVDRRVRVIWNGRDAGEHAAPAGGFVLRAAGYEPAARPKTPELPGTVGDIYETPFALVMGTGAEDPLLAAFIRRAAESARQSWRAWQHVEPRYYLDSQISDEAVRRYSLVLFGGPAENRVTRRLVEKEGLALAIASDAVTVAGQRFPVTDGAVHVVRPHPMNEARYVVVCAGTSAAGMFFADRLPDEYDFVVMDGRRVGWGSDVPFEKGCVAAGFFGPDWQYRESSVMRGDGEVRAKAGLRKAPKHVRAAGAKAKRLALSELLETEAEGSLKHMRRDANWQGKPLTLGGRTFDSGIGAAVWHEPCRARYDLDGGGWKRLRATLGIEIEKPEELEDRQKQNTRVYFVVRGDGKELYRSPTFRWDSAPAEMDVDVSGVRVLELEVGNETMWHCAASSVNWADVRLER